MTSTTAAPEPGRLTAKGRATRARILEHAAALIYSHGVHSTNHLQVRRAAGVSGSQISHYFPTKEHLILGVIDWQTDRVLSLHRGEQFGGFEDFEGFRSWIDFYTRVERPLGCSLGSLASEIIKSDLDVHDELADAFEKWRAIFRVALERLQQRGRLSNEADAARLANLLLAAFQGGMLLAQVAQETSPLRDALRAALDYVETFAITPALEVIDA